MCSRCDTGTPPVLLPLLLPCRKAADSKGVEVDIYIYEFARLR
jgi:hypothetical protein